MSKNEKDKYILMLQLCGRVKNERTSYGKLLFQENLVAHSVVATLHTIAFYINSKNTSIILNFDLDIFENKVPTLGGLANILYPYLKSSPKIKTKIAEYIKLRNNITHNMFSKYKTINKIDLEAKKVVIIGESIINLLNDLRNKIRDN
ncbi:TPA: hypothetical protein DEP94_00025 [Candidatus Nomurabacteria bacterium]|nr:hypothetical protein [Candidatus Nomurabacteria bacterium]